MRVDEALLKLDPSGPNGFEGLVAKLLNELTGQHFRLAKPGSQMGRDMAAHASNANVIAVECKRYRSSTSLDERELNGEMLQAKTSTPDLDIWMLVTSRVVEEQVFRSLYQSAQELDLEFICIEYGDGNPCSLEILAANSIAITIQYLSQILGKNEVVEVQENLSTITASLMFDTKVGELREKLLSPLIGYSAWQSAQNTWFQKHLKDDEKARGAFHQSLNVGSSTVKLIERYALREMLDKWLVEWRTTKTPVVVTGEEGDGKTWGVASWLNSRIGSDSFPPVVFVTSHNASSNVTWELLAQNVERQLGDFKKLISSRLRRWLKRPFEEGPVAILVFDGINERHPREWWRNVLESFLGDDLLQYVALIITCREEYWARNFAKLEQFKFRRFTLPPFNDHELDKALIARGLTTKDLPSNILTLLRKPRYFALAMIHRDRMAQSGDVTPARLIYEDWLDRWQRKTGLPVSDQEFQEILRELASRYMSETTAPRQPEIRKVLSEYVGNEGAPQLMEELRSGGVLEEIDGRYRINKDRLALGLSLLLVAELKSLPMAEGDDRLDEVVAQWLEPRVGMDIKAQVCEMSTVHALPRPDIDLKVKVVLLKTWLDSQNISETTPSAFGAYLPIAPLSYIGLAELVWAHTYENPWAQDLLMHSFRRWYAEASEVTQSLNVAFERWMGFIYPYGFSYLGGTKADKRQEIFRGIQERANVELIPGPFQYAGRSFTVIEDEGLLRLGRLALTLMSNFPKSPFIHSIATGCVAEALMGEPNKYEVFRWVLSTAFESLWPEVKAEVKQLLAADTVVTKQAAHRLLSFEGSNQAFALQHTLPDSLFPDSSLRQLHKTDPCTSGFSWRRADCEVCIQRTELEAQYLARQIGPFCIDPGLPFPEDVAERLRPLARTITPDKLWTTFATGSEDHMYDSYEATLCRVASHELVSVLREAVRGMSSRNELGLRQISFRLLQNSIVLQEDEHNEIIEVWTQLQESGDFAQEGFQFAERFLFRIVLMRSEAAEQLTYLLRRPAELPDLISYVEEFRPLRDWAQVEQLLESELSLDSLRRVLWFISSQTENLPFSLLERYIAPLISHADSFIRSNALELIRNSDAVSLTQTVVERWSWNPEFHEEENYIGSIILCEYGANISFSELSTRIDPLYLGYAVTCRGNQLEEVNLVAKIMHSAWQGQSGRFTEQLADLPDFWQDVDSLSASARSTNRLLDVSYEDAHEDKIRSFDSRRSWGGRRPNPSHNIERILSSSGQRELDDSRLKQVAKALGDQLKRGNLWFGRRFPEEGLAHIIDLRPDLLQEWLETITPDTVEADRLLATSQSFYESLCKVLLECQPKKGIEVYERIYKFGRERGGFHESDSGNRLIDHALFNCADLAEVAPLWEIKIRSCTTDLALLTIAVLAQQGQAGKWLWQFVNVHLQTDIPRDISLAITVLGFLETDAAYEKLLDLSQSAPKTWIGRLVDTSLDRWRKNTWARHWFRLTYASDSDVQAWASFRLFLRCVDKRFWIWRQTMEHELAGHPKFEERQCFVQRNLEQIRNNIKKAGDELDIHLYGQKVLRAEVWPWL